jgi:hypothetical protein
MRWFNGVNPGCRPLIQGARGSATVPGTHHKGVVNMAAAKKTEKKSPKAAAGKKTAKKAK